ncbi:MAG TPA: Gldg family protein [Chthoniobacterales bacterium]|jgi:hypothetical protein
MDEPSSTPPPTYHINRVKIGFNVTLQILLGLIAFGFANYFAFNYFKRWDYSRSKQGTISPQTKKVIGQLDGKLKMVVLVAPATPVSADIKDLLAEYQINAKKQGKKIDIETVNPYQDLNRAKELQQKYKFGTNEAVIILDYAGRTKFVNVVDMLEFGAVENAISAPELKGFKGEQVLTQGLLGVIEPTQNKIYFVEGMGGLDFIGKPHNKTFMTYLERQNLATASLNLLNLDKIPEDAKALFITAPKYDPTDRALKLLKEYWSKKGRIFIFLDPNQSTPNLIAWLGEMGVTVQDNRVTKTEPLEGGLLGVYKNTISSFLAGHPITKELGGIRTSLDGPTRSLTIDQTKAKDSQLRLTPLLTADTGYWGEKEYAAGEDAPLQFDKGVDQEAPVVLAVAIEQGAVNDDRVKMDSARLVCLANADFLNDQRLVSQNLDFSIASVNWLVSREDLISIPAIEKKNVKLGLTQDQLSKLSLYVLILIPAGVALLGIGVCWQRRR